MSSTRFARLISASLIALFVLHPSLAFAAPPTFQTVPVDFSGLEVPISTACGFPIQAELTGAFKVSTRIDQNGRTIEIDRASELQFTLTNLNTGTTLSSPNHGPTKTTTQPDGSITIDEAGLFASFHLPGQGVVLKDAGRLVFDQAGNVVFEAGKHPLVDGADVSALCAALG